MKLLIVMLCFALVSCSACLPKKDPVESPATANLQNLLISVNGLVKTGIAEVVGDGNEILVRTPHSGSVFIRGFGDCGYHNEFDYSDSYWTKIDLEEFPNYDYCEYSVLV